MARPTTADAGPGGYAILVRLRNNGVYVALALLVLFNLFFTTNFATAGTILGLLSQATFVLLVALGLTLVIGTGGIDLSVGAIMAIASAVVPLYLGYSWPVAVLVALIFCVLAGMLNGFLVAYVGMQPIVATLALFVGGRGFAQVLVNGQLQTISDPGFLALWRATVFGVPMPVVVAAVAAVLVGLLARRTTFGRYVLAVGGNRTASYLSGHPVRGVLLAVYAISGLLAGLAGTLATARLAAGDPATIGLLIRARCHRRGRDRWYPALRRADERGGYGRGRDTHAGHQRHFRHEQHQPHIRSDLEGGDHRSRGVHPAGKEGVLMATGTTVERDTLRRERIFGAIQRRGALAVLVAIVVVAGLTLDLFLTPRNIEDVLLHASFVGLISVGMTFVIITGGIDLSVGSLVALGGVLAGLSVGISWPLGLLVPTLACGLYGFVNGLLIAKAKLPAFIVTLAGLLGIRGLALVLSGTLTIPIPGPPAFVWFGRGEIFGLDVPIVVMFGAFAVGALVLNRSRYGEAVFAVGGSEEAARLAGVRVDRVKIIAYTTSGALAGLAGALVAAWLSAGQPTVGQAWELYAIASVVLGGTLLTGGAGTMLGSLVGVLLFYTIQNVINQVGTLTSYTQQLVTGIFLIVVVAAQTYLTRQRTY